MSTSNSIFWNIEIRNGVSYYSEPMPVSKEVEQLKQELAKVKAELNNMKEEKEQAEKNCIICCDKKANIVFMPCCHMVCCEDCSAKLLANYIADGGKNECPLCKMRIGREKKVYQL